MCGGEGGGEDERMKISKYQVPENAHFIESGLAILLNLNLASPTP